jgi:hypothetical protein
MAPTAFDKIDFRRERKDLYAPGRDFEVVEVPPFVYLMVDGEGNPNTSPAYVAAVEALYGLSYAAKFASKLDLGRDYVVGPLEGLWWGEGEFAALSKDEWSWTMMIRQPDWLTPELWQAARAKVAKKQLSALDAVRLETLDEGLSVQFLHVGSYDDEAPTIARMHEWIAANGYVETTAHHEIYLSDPRRTEVSRLKTIVRQPMRPRD